jgi:hypothetical protein
MRWSKLQPLVVSSGFNELLELHEADGLVCGRDLRHVEYCRALLLRPGEEINPAPLLTGDDLIGRGIPQGSIYKVLLEQVRAAQLDAEIVNKDGAWQLVERLLAKEADAT